MIKIFFLLFITLSIQYASAQKLFGTIKTSEGSLLPFASVTIKNTTKGVSANNQANYSFQLNDGDYEIICQHIGYQSVSKRVTISGDTKLDFQLPIQQLTLSNVVINTQDNPANAIIREAIKKRPLYESQATNFICNLYGKDVIRLNKLPDRIMGQKVPEGDKAVMGLDSTGSGIIYLSESVSKAFVSGKKMKLEVISSRLSGSNSFGFTFPAFISLYSNNVEVFNNSFNSRGYISPISDNAFHYYQFKMLGTFFENDKMIHSIKVIPKRKFEPLFSGILNISDEDWHIQSYSLILTKESQLEIIDTLKISQLHVPLKDGIWHTKNQLLHFNVKMFSIDAEGNFLTVYNDYEPNPQFDKNIFDNVVIRYDTAVNKRSKSYWDTIRPVPLEQTESRDYQIKDSLLLLRQDSTYWANNIDSLKKRQGKIKPWELLYSGINRTHYSKKNQYNWSIETLLTNTGYNLAEGFVMELKGHYSTSFSNKKYSLKIHPTIRYGFGNTHLNSSADIDFRKNREADDNLNRLSWKISGGKTVMQYNSDNPVNPLVNSYTTLMFGKNEMKTYEKEFISIGVTKKYESGIKFSIKTEFANRIPIWNSTHYTFRKKDSINITENYPVERVQQSEVYSHQALLIGFKFSIKPGQKFIQFPKSKISLGSKFPTISFSYVKGLYDILGSDVDFDKWSLGINDDRNLKMAGLLKYNISIGGFLNDKKVFIQDFKHFNSNSVRATSSYVSGFQLLSSYAQSNTANFYAEMHVEHHFNGMLTNKIPGIKKLNWNLVAGTNSYMISKHNYYVEYFVGLENIFKLFRIDFVSSYLNGHYYKSNVVFGTGGLLGDGLNKKSSDGRTSINIVF